MKPTRQLRHENVIRFIGVCTHPQHLCIITELCTKGDLFDVIRRYKKPNFAQQVTQPFIFFGILKWLIPVTRSCICMILLSAFLTSIHDGKILLFCRLYIAHILCIHRPSIIHRVSPGQRETPILKNEHLTNRFFLGPEIHEHPRKLPIQYMLYQKEHVKRTR